MTYIRKTHRYGLLVPSSNSTQEPEFSQALPDFVSLHTGRLSWSRIDADTVMRSVEEIEFESRKLADADVDVIVLGIAADQPCTVDDHIERAQRRNQRVDRMTIGHVERPNVDVCKSGLRPRRCHFLLGQTAGNHPCTGALKRNRCGGPDPRGTTRDQHRAAAELKVRLRDSPPLKKEGPLPVLLGHAQQRMTGLTRKGLEVALGARVGRDHFQDLATAQIGERLLGAQDR